MVRSARKYSSVLNEYIDQDIAGFKHRDIIRPSYTDQAKYEFVLEEKDNLNNETENDHLLLQSLKNQINELNKKVEMLENKLQQSHNNFDGIDEENEESSTNGTGGLMEYISDAKYNTYDRPLPISNKIPELTKNFGNDDKIKTVYDESVRFESVKPKSINETILSNIVWSDTTSRRALDETCAKELKIGHLFDCINEKFVTEDIFKNYTNDTFTFEPKFICQIIDDPSAENLFNALQLEDELKASIVCGLKTLPEYTTSMISYTLEDRNSMFLLYSLTLKTMQVDKSSRVLINQENIEKSSDATHFIESIDFGYTAVLCVKFHEEYSNINNDTKLKSALEDIKQVLLSKSILKNDYTNIYIESLKFDHLPATFHLQPKNVKEAVSILQTLSAEENVESAGPIRYHLESLESLKLKPIIKSRTCPKPTVNAIVEAYAEFQNTIFDCRIEGTPINLIHLYPFIPIDFEAKLQNMQKQQKEEEAKLFIDTKIELVKYRLGKISENQLKENVISLYTQVSEYFDIRNILDKKLMDKFKYIEHLRRKHVICVGKNYDIIKVVKNFASCYVLFWTENSLESSKNRRLFDRFIGEEKEAKMVFVDLGNSSKATIDKTSKITFYKHGKVDIENVLAFHQSRLEKQRCFIKRPSQVGLQKDRRPAFKATLKISCPNAWKGLCSNNEHEWFCETCQKKVSYGLDQCIHCDCGAFVATCCLYKCNDFEHGNEFMAFENMNEYQKLLDKLPKPREQNILLLGETGVGKSTFINALANYLTFNSLQEALNSKPISIVASKFVITELNATGFNKHTVNIGDASRLPGIPEGQSVTQTAMAYTFEVNQTIVRIIDTPGVNDTRGQQQDDLNFNAILDYISKYSSFNAILILLKPNESRLTAALRKCLYDLFAQMHSTNITNILFCFTNARNTFYKPGETLQSLKSFVRENNFSIDITDKIVYLVENDAFRYIWAKYRGLNYVNSNEHDCQIAWNHSRKEIERLLNYITCVKNKPIQEIISKTNSVKMAAWMLQPLADVSLKLKQNLILLEQVRAKIVQNTQNPLSEVSSVPQIKLINSGLTYPRLVCRSAKCSEQTTISRKLSIHGIFYKSPCHENCSLDELPPSVDRAGIQKCEIFGKDKLKCSACGCLASHHIHICYELIIAVEKISFLENRSTNSLLKSAKERLDELFQKMVQDQNKIFEANAIYVYFLGKNSVERSSDLFEEYLGTLLQSEYEYGNFEKKSLIESLIEDYKNEKARTIKNIEQKRINIDPLYVDRFKRDLFNLETCGKDIQALFEAVCTAHTALRNESHYAVPMKYSIY